MKHINKSSEVPKPLKEQKVKKEFRKTVKNKRHDPKNDVAYRNVKSYLVTIYQGKCAYCESKVMHDQYGNIDHFCPKSIYYWLAYSWDNLVLCCNRCNSEKDRKFPVAAPRVAYNNENPENLHHKGLEYDRREKPQFINPERENPEDFFEWMKNGSMKPLNERMDITIKEIDLNRDELKDLRVSIFNRQKKRMLFKLYNELNEVKVDNDIVGKIVDKKLKEFKNEVPQAEEDHEQFSSWRKAIINHEEWFIEDLMNG